MELCRRQKLEIFHLRSSEDLESALQKTKPVALAWDLSGAQPADWSLVRRMRHYPNLSQAPFILYGQLAEQPLAQVGLTGFVVKSSNTRTLLDTLNAMRPTRRAGPILIVDDDPQVREAHKALVQEGLPGYPICLTEDGEKALARMAQEAPSLVLLDLVMPALSGADVLDQMRGNLNLRHVPVIILSNKVMSLEDVKRIEGHTHVTLQTKGIWSDEETVSALNRAVFGTDTLPPHTSGLVKQAIAYLHQNHMRPLRLGNRRGGGGQRRLSQPGLQPRVEHFTVGLSQSISCAASQTIPSAHNKYDQYHCPPGGFQRPGLLQPACSTRSRVCRRRHSGKRRRGNSSNTKETMVTKEKTLKLSLFPFVFLVSFVFRLFCRGRLFRGHGLVDKIAFLAPAIELKNAYQR